MSNLRKEYELRKERRKRAIENLFKEAVINVLAEQQLIQSQPEEAPAPQAPVQVNSSTDANNSETPAADEQNPPPVATPQLPNSNYTVDDMIRELNAIRSGRSFTDPEIYGRLLTFFKSLSDEQRSMLNSLLTRIAELVTGVDEVIQTTTQTPGNANSSAPQPPPPSAPATTEAPQEAAPMPGAQQAAGAAGVGNA